MSQLTSGIIALNMGKNITNCVPEAPSRVNTKPYRDLIGSNQTERRVLIMVNKLSP